MKQAKKRRRDINGIFNPKGIIRLALVGIALGFVFGCSENDTSEKINQITLNARYSSMDYGVLERSYFYVFNNEVCELGVTLFLEEDSTFSLNNCGGISQGRFVFRNDSLELFKDFFLNSYDSVKYIDGDSIMDYGYKVHSDGILISQSEFISTSGKKYKKRVRLRQHR
jgi:hypothetical protein